MDWILFCIFLAATFAAGATGATSLRWGPPGAIFTMDYRQDRVNVMYDDNSMITEVRCG